MKELFTYFRSLFTPLIIRLYNQRLRRILTLIELKTKQNSNAPVLLDLGCGGGNFSYALSSRFTTIGLDVTKNFKIKKKPKGLDFVLADLSSLPFRKDSADIIISASVLEHIQKFDGVAKEIKDVLKKDAIFIAGYPVETRLFKFVWRLINPSAFRCIDQRYWCDQHTDEQECYWESPHTHKKDYQTIRRELRTHFQVLQKEKLLFNTLPDLFTYYECVKMLNKKIMRI